jgi:ubiquinone/menaquinone biosynthesis C-methylase UbiE
MNDNIIHWDNVSNQITFQAPVEFDKIEEHLPLTSRILDYGCGYGRIAKQLVGIGYKNIKGYDNSEKMIERAKRENPNIHFSLVTGSIPEEDDYFDGIICSALFTCIPNEEDKLKVINDLERKLKRNGYLFITEYSIDEQIEPEEFVSSVGAKMKFLRICDIRKLTKEFNEISCEKTNAKTLSGKDAICLQYVGKKK